MVIRQNKYCKKHNIYIIPTLHRYENLTDIIHKRDGEEVTRIMNGAQLPESLDDEPLPLGDDVEDGVGLGEGPVRYLEGAGAVGSSAAASAAAYRERRSAGTIEGVRRRAGRRVEPAA